jgi:predicted ABC-type sugar transport system permease subunit
MSSLTITAERDQRNWIVTWLTAMRAWAFLILLLIVFELWARIVYRNTFLFNPFNLESIAIFTVAPLLVALGQTFVIISSGIDLSIGFAMGLAAVVFARCLNSTGSGFGDAGSVVISVVIAIVAGTGWSEFRNGNGATIFTQSGNVARRFSQEMPGGMVGFLLPRHTLRSPDGISLFLEISMFKEMRAWCFSPAKKWS